MVNNKKMLNFIIRLWNDINTNKSLIINILSKNNKLMFYENE
ncbi:hypothetical protein J3D55_001231 [Chryseobacterium ginsenosidimutans]|nr:hypothetical protein [Chryseobacterium ginsenosidimutans]